MTSVDTQGEAYGTSFTVKRRQTKQDRSAARRQRITQGAVVAISEHGIAGVTHRSVAEKAGVSLTATTYYYATKNDIIIDASQELLNGYVAAFRRFADKHRESAAERPSFRDFAFRLITNAGGRHGVASRAWCEIIANTGQQPELGHLSRDWFTILHNVWEEIARVLRVEAVEESVTSAIDAVIGFMFMLLPLGLDEQQVHSFLMNGGSGLNPSFLASPEVNPSGSKKAAETRERILEAAIEILVTEGVDALSFRHVAAKAGLTSAAPTYHYPSISILWNAAQQRIFENARLRHRSVMGAINYASLDIDRLVDLMTTVFVREATEFRNMSRASYQVYIQSRRDPALRAGLWKVDSEQQRVWSEVLARFMPGSPPLHSWIMNAVFIGKLIRILSTGGEVEALARVRSEFAYELCSMALGTHWSGTFDKTGTIVQK